MRKYVLGVVLGAILAVGPALAMKWSFSGSFRVDPTFTSTKVGTLDAVTDFAIVDPGNSRFRLKGVMNDGSYLYFEVKALYGTWHSTGAINTASWGLRHAYALINTPYGKVKFGHTWSVLDFLFANQRLRGDRSGLGYGDLYGGRVWEVVFCKGPAKVAIVEPKAVSLIGGNTRVELPKIEASFSYGPANVSVSYNSYKEEWTHDTITISSFAVAAFANLPLGPATVTVNGYFGQNLFVYPLEGVYHKPYVDTTATSASVENTTGMGGFAQVKAQAGKGLLTVGFGADMAKEPKENAWNLPGLDNTDKETALKMVAYGNYKLNLTKSFYIQPEVSVFIDKVGDEDENKTTQTFVGVHLQYEWK